MTDLTKIEKPLGLLTPEDRHALASLPWDQIEVYGMSGWCSVGDKPIWVETATYRAKRPPRRWWIVGGCEAYNDLVEAKEAASTLASGEIIEVIEVHRTTK